MPASRWRAIGGALAARGRITDRAHFDGVAGAAGRLIRTERSEDAGSTVPAPALLRPLAEYEAVAGGAW